MEKLKSVSGLEGLWNFVRSNRTISSLTLSTFSFKLQSRTRFFSSSSHGSPFSVNNLTKRGVKGENTQFGVNQSY